MPRVYVHVFVCVEMKEMKTFRDSSLVLLLLLHSLVSFVPSLAGVLRSSRWRGDPWPGWRGDPWLGWREE